MKHNRFRTKHIINTFRKISPCAVFKSTAFVGNIGLQRLRHFLLVRYLRYPYVVGKLSSGL